MKRLATQLMLAYIVVGVAFWCIGFTAMSLVDEAVRKAAP